jgi:hypothetical protein
MQIVGGFAPFKFLERRIREIEYPAKWERKFLSCNSVHLYKEDVVEWGRVWRPGVWERGVESLC